MKKVVVISLGGSLIIPEKINFHFLHEFKKVLRKHYRSYRFVVVCGGGVIARKYISALRSEGRTEKELAMAGIRATRMNARFMMQFFGSEANESLPMDMKGVRSDLEKNKVVFCGALRFAPDSTSDSTAAKLAHYLKTDFINMTNVRGLFSDNPLKNRKARFIAVESWKKFEQRARKIKFRAGQNFVLDQNAATLIRKHRIKTYIIGPDRDLDNVLSGKRIRGSVIVG